jgi:hypothetical protein
MTVIGHYILYYIKMQNIIFSIYLDANAVLAATVVSDRETTCIYIVLYINGTIKLVNG